MMSIIYYLHYHVESASATSFPMRIGYSAGAAKLRRKRYFPYQDCPVTWDLYFAFAS